MDKWENTRRGKKTKHTNPKQAARSNNIIFIHRAIFKPSIF